MTKCAELANLIGNINAGGGGVNKNVIINGNMNVAQRGTSSTGLGGSDGYFTCDRWKLAFNTSGRLTATQDSSAPSGFANSLKLACTTADTSVAASEYLFLSQKIEGQDLQRFAKGTSDAKPFAVSFYVKGNASATYVAELYDEDNNRVVGKSFTVGTDWARVELSMGADTTGALDDDNAASLTFQIWLHAGSTYNSGTLNTTWGSVTQANRAVGGSSFFDSTDRTFFITGVQLEVGQNPTSFEHEPFERTMAKCQRYFKHFQSDTSDSRYMHFFGGFLYNTTLLICAYPIIPKMRAQPSLGTTGTASDYQVLFVGTNSACTSVPSLDGQSEPDNLDIRAECSSATAGSGGTLRAANTVDAFITLDAEL